MTKSELTKKDSDREWVSCMRSNCGLLRWNMQNAIEIVSLWRQKTYREITEQCYTKQLPTCWIENHLRGDILSSIQEHIKESKIQLTLVGSAEKSELFRKARIYLT